jgi:hypothetical protein
MAPIHAMAKHDGVLYDEAIDHDNGADGTAIDTSTLSDAELADYEAWQAGTYEEPAHDDSTYYEDSAPYDEYDYYDAA